MNSFTKIYFLCWGVCSCYDGCYYVGWELKDK